MIRILFRILSLIRRRWFVWLLLAVMLLATLNVVAMYILKTGVDPYSPFHTWILRNVPQLWPWQ